MREREPLIWRLIAKVVSLPGIRDALIRRSMKTPYTHIRVPGTPTLYMERYWLLNPYNRAYVARRGWLPSVRLHLLHAPDEAAHPHDHPLRTRVIILRGWYCESRYAAKPMFRGAGDTYALRPGVDFHHIYAVPANRPTVSLFITWPKRPEGVDGEWGFLVDGVKIPSKVYLSGKRD